jgi:hypothetical protein
MSLLLLLLLIRLPRLLMVAVLPHPPGGWRLLQQSQPTRQLPSRQPAAELSDTQESLQHLVTACSQRKAAPWAACICAVLMCLASMKAMVLRPSAGLTCTESGLQSLFPMAVPV